MKKNEIIDFDRKGNVVRFYLGENGKQWGDDWDDAPYDCNAGDVYLDFVSGVKDVSFPFDDLVLEPCSGKSDCGYTKQDMIKRYVPCIIVVPKELWETVSWKEDDFSFWVGNDKVKKYYFGDEI